MRITGGRARGRVLKGRAAEGVRPTSSRVREALFSMVGQDLDGERVLDAFGGSGLLGLEAWSRGAEVVTVERRPGVARAIRDAAGELGAVEGFSVRVGDVVALAPSLGSFDGVLADPPYALDPEPILAALGPLAARWLVFETSRERRLPGRAGALALARERPFGNTTLWVYRCEE